MLELRRISKTFNPGTINEIRSLQDLSLSIEEGSFVTVIGTNGSGKSTLMNAVAGAFFVDLMNAFVLTMMLALPLIGG